MASTGWGEETHMQNFGRKPEGCGPGSVDGIVTAYGLDGPGIESP